MKGASQALVALGLGAALGTPLPVEGAVEPTHAAGARVQRQLKTRGTSAGQQASAVRDQAVRFWWKCLGAAVHDIQKFGAGGYSTSNAAHESLAGAFSWNEKAKMLVFQPAGARPSFCSGAVYAAVLSALAKWDAGHNPRCISPEAWQALMPLHVADGVGAWGQANANGPGLAVLVHRLGAGVNFTDGGKARPGDIMKIWWNDKVGARERGHLVIFVKDDGDSVRVWSSHQAGDGFEGGFGFKSFPKSSISRVLYTRITNPAAFNKAPLLGTDEWLSSLLREDVSWEDCLLHAGLQKRP